MVVASCSLARLCIPDVYGLFLLDTTFPLYYKFDLGFFFLPLKVFDV